MKKIHSIIDILIDLQMKCYRTNVIHRVSIQIEIYFFFCIEKAEKNVGEFASKPEWEIPLRL